MTDSWDHPYAKIRGHRGSPADARGNTIPSFEAALRQGADVVEFDVRRAADELVVTHDPAVAGTPVTEYTVEKLRAKEGYEQTPTLEETFKYFSQNDVDVELRVELKDDVAEEVLYYADEYGLLEEETIVLHSFNPSYFDAVAADDAVRKSLVTAEIQEEEQREVLLETAGQYNCDIVSIPFEQADEEYIRRIEQEGFRSDVWGHLEEKEDFKAAFALQPHYVSANDVRAAYEAREELLAESDQTMYAVTKPSRS